MIEPRADLAFESRNHFDVGADSYKILAIHPIVADNGMRFPRSLIRSRRPIPATRPRGRARESGDEVKHGGEDKGDTEI